MRGHGKLAGSKESFFFNVFTCNYVHGGGIMQVRAVLGRWEVKVKSSRQM